MNSNIAAATANRMNANDLKALSILVVEDESLLRRQLAANLDRFGAEVATADSLAATRQRLQAGQFDFVLLDVNLPDGLGTELLREKAFPPATAVIVMTANGGVTSAVEAMRLGATDYLVKPFDPGELPLVIARAQRTRQSARLDEQQRDDTAQTAAVFFFGRALADLETQLQRILDADARMQTQLPPVLVQGETGTGKTTIARWLHQRGARAAQAFVEVNCSALPDSLAESELFGHERGAFTDARTARIGLFEAASGGTLLLDELPSLSPALQAKVLKVIEDNRLRRLGGARELSVDTRIIAATNQDCRALVAAGKFREDLFHRLDLYRIQIPPLRERGEDALKLAEALLENLCRRHRVPVKRLTAAARQRILACAWPGNVRELSHELERAIVFESGPELNLEQLQTPIDPNKSVPHTEWLYRLRCLNGRLLAVGENGVMLTSTNGTNWTSIHSGVTNWLNDAVMISNTCYVVGNQGVVLTSTNFANWTNIGAITAASLDGAATQNGQLVVAGFEGTILRSQVLPVLTPVNFVSFGQAGGYNVFSVAGVAGQQFTLDSSTNLVSWQTGPLYDLIYGDGTLVFYQSLPVPPPCAQFYRCTLAP